MKGNRGCDGAVSDMGNDGFLTGNKAIIESMRVTGNGGAGIDVSSGTVSGNTANRQCRI